VGERDLARLRELEARVRHLQEENAQLAGRQADAALLGLVAEQVYLEAEPHGILRVALEQVSVLKGVPLCLVGDLGGSHGGADLVVRHAWRSGGEARLEGQVLRLGAPLVEGLQAGAVLLRGAECAAAGLTAEALGGQPVGSAFLVPFTSRALPRGLFAFAHPGPGDHLVEITPVLARVVETVASRLENVALLHELLALNAALDQRVGDELEGEVTERRRTEEALRRSEEGLRLALSAAAMASVDWELPTGRLTWSDGAAALLGSAPPTVEAWLAAIHGEDRGAVAALLAAAPQGGRRTVLVHRLAADPSRWLVLRAGALAGPGGLAARVTGVLSDVTERHRMNEELLQAQKLDSIGRLAGGVAHDFTTCSPPSSAWASCWRPTCRPGRRRRPTSRPS
jgi:PAS domain-containing protein